MSLAELFANEEALRHALALALANDAKCEAACAASKAASADALASHSAALVQFESALNVPVEPEADPTPAPAMP